MTDLRLCPHDEPIIYCSVCVPTQDILEAVTAIYDEEDHDFWPHFWQLHVDAGDQCDNEEEERCPCCDSALPCTSGCQQCHECKGTGQYVGLNEIEFCDVCDGSGWL